METEQLSSGTYYVAQMLYRYWQQGVDFGHGYEHGKVDPAVVHAHAQEVAEHVLKADR